MTAQQPATAAGQTSPRGRATVAVRQSSLRESNLAALVAAVCASEVPPSRADLAASLGITRATASRLADELVDAGLLDEVTREQVGPGRPARPLVPGERVLALGLSVEVDRLVVRAVDLRGRLVAERSAPTPVGDAGTVLAGLAELARSVRQGLRGLTVVGAGVAVPGVVADRRLLVRAPNLGWSEVDVPAHLPTVSGRRAVVGNEADLAAVVEAEPVPGRAGPWSDFVHVTARTGVGGAVVSGGQVVVGEHGAAGELGHVCVDPHGPVCPCGSTGCLERYAGLEALAAASGLAPDRVAADLGVRAAAGDARCAEALATLSWSLSIALASVVNVVGISSVVLGGHLAQLEPYLHDDLAHRLQQRVLGSRWDPVRLRPALADPGVSATGAAFLVLEDVITSPATWLPAARG